jgi:hypothetical protein
MPAWATGAWSADAWAGTAWDETAPTIGTAWFANAWAPGAWGSASWAGADAPPPVPWDLEQPTLGPQMAATFAASGNFEFGALGALPFDLVQTAPAALAAVFAATGEPVSSEVSPGASAAEVWGYLFGNGQTAEQNVLRILQLAEDLHARYVK